MSQMLIYEPDRKKQKKLKKILQELCLKIDEEIPIHEINNEEEALQYMQEETVAVAFVSWDKPKGFFISKAMKVKNYRLNVVVLCETEYKFIHEFWHYHMSGYVIGEPTREKVQEELENLRYSW